MIPLLLLALLLLLLLALLLFTRFVATVEDDFRMVELARDEEGDEEGVTGAALHEELDEPSGDEGSSLIGRLAGPKVSIEAEADWRLVGRDWLATLMGQSERLPDGSLSRGFGGSLSSCSLTPSSITSSWSSLERLSSTEAAAAAANAALWAADAKEACKSPS